MLILEALLSSLLALVSIIFHGTGLLLLGRLLRRIDPGDQAGLNAASWSGMFYTSILALGLLMLAGVEIWFYAGVYVAIGAIPLLRDAVYFSTTTYAAIGYSDAAIVEEWKLLGAIEGITGVILLGWSVAFLVTRLRRLRG